MKSCKRSVPGGRPAARIHRYGDGFLKWIGVLFLTLGCAASSQEPRVPSELEDGRLSVIVFPVYDEPFIAPNLSAGLLPERGGAEHFQGIDIDLMVDFADSLGAEIEFMRLSEPGFGALLPALVAGRADAVASALTITDERDRMVDFSRPYFGVSTVVVARRDSRIRALADLEGKVAVGVKGSRPFSVLMEQGVEVRKLEADFQTGAYAAVVEGEADFAMMESASARHALLERPELEIALDFGDTEGYGVAVRNGSELKMLLDAYLDRIEASGQLTATIDRWLGPGSSPSAGL